MKKIITFLIAGILAGTAHAEPLNISYQISVNGQDISDCTVYVSEQKGDSPPDIPSEQDDILIASESESVRLVIKCRKQEGLQDVVRILQRVTGIRE